MILTKLDNGYIIGSDGKPCRGENIDWPATPEEIGN